MDGNVPSTEYSKSRYRTDRFIPAQPQDKEEIKLKQMNKESLDPEALLPA